MNGYSILTNRKRAIVALVHSVAFLGVAGLGFLSTASPLRRGAPASAWAMVGVYTLVSAILLTLMGYSRNATERLYFAFCSCSASFGLLRQILGDPRMRAAVYVRVTALAIAVYICLRIVREHSPAREAAMEPLEQP